jgi:DNA-binding transcriptional ArsR family regulator
VTDLRIGQPSVSKHLRVLLGTNLVKTRRAGRRMLYRTNAEAIRSLHEWAGQFA